MFKRLSSLLLIACLIGSVFSSCQKVTSRYNPPRDQRLLTQFKTEELSQIVWEYFAEVHNDKRLHLDQAYECTNDHTVLHLEFHTQHILELCQARELLVDVVEGLLDRINFHPEASKLVKPYPLTADQLEIYIDFESYHGIYVDPFYIGWVVLEEGMSYFYAFSLKNRKKDYWHSRIEPYFKSRSFVHWAREGVKHYKATHPEHGGVLIPERHYAPTQERVTHSH